MRQIQYISLGINQSGSNCSRVSIVPEFLQNECFLSCSDYYWLSFEGKLIISNSLLVFMFMLLYLDLAL
jgi:hypothetical protein